jgi:protein associated with RNAse G/E
VTSVGGEEVRVVVRKFDGSLHRHHRMVRLGEDEHGVRLGAPVGTIYDKGERSGVYATEERRVMLFPRDAWWTALFQEAPHGWTCTATSPRRSHGRTGTK